MSHPPEGWGMFALLAALSVGAGLAGVGAAVLTYNRPAELWRRFEASFGRLWDAWQNAYWVDDLYGMAIVAARPGRLAEATAFRFDLPVVDGLVNGCRSAGQGGRRLGPGPADRSGPQLRPSLRRRHRRRDRLDAGEGSMKASLRSARGGWWRGGVARVRTGLLNSPLVTHHAPRCPEGSSC